MDAKSMGARMGAWVKKRTDFFLEGARLFVIAALFFGSGILYTQHFLFSYKPFTIQEPAAISAATLTASAIPLARTGTGNQQAPSSQTAAQQVQKGGYAASKNGTKYYRITCANRIREENKIYFLSEQDAKKAGYAPSATCFK